MKKLFQNISLLFMAQMVSYVIPLLEIPILGRGLGVGPYGQIVLIQSCAVLLSLVAEYGFTISASRQAAVVRESPAALGRLFGDVLSAKLVIVVVMTASALGAWRLSDGAGFNNTQWLCGYMYYLAFALSPFWIFQGRENMAGVILIELVLRFLGLGVLFICVTRPADATLAIAIMAGFSIANTIITNVIALRSLDSVKLSADGGMDQLRGGFHSFIYKSSGSIFSSAGPAVVGAACGHAAVALYAPAEKLVKGVVSLAAPVLVGLYPFITRRFMSQRETSMLLAWSVIAAIFVGGMIAASVLYFAGGWLIGALLGPTFESAQVLLSLFVILIPFRMAGQAVGLMILMPMGRDRITSALMVGFAMLSLVAGGIAGSWWGVEALVTSFIGVEVLLCLSLVCAALMIRRDSVSAV